MSSGVVKLFAAVVIAGAAFVFAGSAVAEGMCGGYSNLVVSVPSSSDASGTASIPPAPTPNGNGG